MASYVVLLESIFIKQKSFWGVWSKNCNKAESFCWGSKFTTEEFNSVLFLC